MIWSKQQSIFLTKLCIMIFIGGYLAVVFTCPVLMDIFVRSSISAAGKSKWLFMGTVYACAIPTGILLFQLWRLITDIGLENIFTNANILRLRLISWMCFAISAICLVSMVYYLFWGIITACFALMGLLIRVIKNTFEQAKEIKEEADYTI
ncbi:MAG: DUF2975 domain-containing protein [Lachnospiraceae bacterium]|jgi:hypothetical protein|nr:DUF2975 domain-containing protein [Lachnospiraceae bacterium]